MDIKGGWNDLKKIHKTVLITGSIAVLSLLLGKLAELYVLKEMLRIFPHSWAWALALIALILAIAIYVHEHLDNKEHEKAPQHKLGATILFLLLSLVMIIGIELLAGISEHWLLAGVHGAATGAVAFIFICIAILGLSVWAYRTRREFQNVYFPETSGNKKPLANSSKGIGLIIPLSTPKILVKDAPYEDQGFAESWVQAFGSMTLQEVCAAIRATKKGVPLNIQAQTSSSIEATTRFFQSILRHNWAMLLLTLEWLVSQSEHPQRIHILASNGGTDPRENSCHYLKDAKTILAHFGLTATDSTASFFELKAIYDAVRTVLRQPDWMDLPVFIDITSGTKQVSLGAGAASMHQQHCQIIYAHTHDLTVNSWNPTAHDTSPVLGA